MKTTTTIISFYILFCVYIKKDFVVIPKRKRYFKMSRSPAIFLAPRNFRNYFSFSFSPFNSTWLELLRTSLLIGSSELLRLSLLIGSSELLKPSLLIGTSELLRPSLLIGSLELLRPSLLIGSLELLRPSLLIGSLELLRPSQPLSDPQSL